MTRRAFTVGNQYISLCLSVSLSLSLSLCLSLLRMKRMKRSAMLRGPPRAQARALASQRDTPLLDTKSDTRARPPSLPEPALGRGRRAVLLRARLCPTLL